MHFYVDESGQTGLNLFDESQPYLYYGTLSSPYDLNVTARPYIEKIRSSFGVDRLHANALGVGRLDEVAQQIDTIQRKNEIAVDFCKISKVDHAAICFFDQVFDQGLNKAVPWTSYWTPLRYVLLLKVAYLFDYETLQKAWAARIEIKDRKASELFIEVCRTLLDRVSALPDERSRVIISDSLRWAIQNPDEIHYNVYDKQDRLQISPNLIGFQSVLHGISSRLESKKCKALSIVVDRQGEFNGEQRWLTEVYQKTRDQTWQVGPGLPEMNLRHIPDFPIACTPGDNSIGLEIVDIYLWMFKRTNEGKNLSPKLNSLLAKQLAMGDVQEVSLAAISTRWEHYFSNLPDPTGEDLIKAKEMRAAVEAKRAPYVASLHD